MNSLSQQIIDNATALDTAIASAKAKLEALQSIKIFSALERTPWTLAPGTAGNTGSTGSAANGIFLQPGVNCANIGIVPKGPYANRYWYKQFGADVTKTKYRYEASFLFPSDTDSQACQAIEMDIQQVVAGGVFNPAIQFDFAENAIRLWNRSAGTQGEWESIGVTCARWSANVWNIVAINAHRAGNTIAYDSIETNFGMAAINSVSGITYPIRNLAMPDMMNCALQLDGNKAGSSYKVMIDNVNFTIS